MTQQKSTKRALLSSVLATLLCVAMLVGATFAWFTDTASTAVNKIQSGKLNVTLEMSNDGVTWENAENKTLSFLQRQADGTVKQAENILWEPGCTYNLPMLRVVNEGSLALKYKIKITGIKGDAKLNEAIDWTINDASLDSDHKLAVGATSEALTISGKMRTDADNTYQNLSIDGIGITVYATQDTVENDSNGNQYDKDATYDQKAIYTVDTFNALKAAAANVKPGDTVVLSKDLTLSERVLFSASGITFDGNGHTIKAVMSDQQVEGLATLLAFGSGTTYCTGVTVKNVNFTGKGGRAMHFHGGTSSVIENVHISGEWSLAINFYGTHGAVMNNCDISSTYANKYAKASIFANEQSANQIVLNNTKIDSMFVNATEKGGTYANGGIKLIVNAGSEVGELHTNTGITRTFYEVNGGTIGSVLADL